MSADGQDRRRILEISEDSIKRGSFIKQMPEADEAVAFDFETDSHIEELKSFLDFHIIEEQIKLDDEQRKIFDKEIVPLKNKYTRYGSDLYRMYINRLLRDGERQQIELYVESIKKHMVKEIDGLIDRIEGKIADNSGKRSRLH